LINFAEESGATSHETETSEVNTLCEVSGVPHRHALNVFDVKHIVYVKHISGVYFTRFRLLGSVQH